MARADLLHDASLPLGEGDVTTRLVLDELDLDLSAFAATLLVVVIIIVTSHGGSGSLDATGVGAVASELVARRWVVEPGVRVKLISHDGWESTRDVLQGSLE